MTPFALSNLDRRRLRAGLVRSLVGRCQPGRVAEAVWQARARYYIDALGGLGADW